MGSLFAACIDMEDLARANMVWVHYYRIRRKKKYYLGATNPTVNNLLQALRRGMTNPPDQQASRDVDDQELTAAHLLRAFGLVKANEKAGLKIFDHSLPWPSDIRAKYSRQLKAVGQC